MKILCDREKLAAAFATAVLFAPRKSAKPILESVKLIADKDSVTLLATDMEIGIRQSVAGVSVTKPGSVILPADSFASILRESSDEKLQVETVKNEIVVKGERSEFTLSSEDANEFPDVAKFEEEKYSLIDVTALRTAISRTEYATDTDSMRYALGAVCLDIDQAKLIAVGCDGKRMAKIEFAAESIAGHKAETALLPTRAAKAVCKAMNGVEGQVKIACRQNDILIATDSATFYARQTEGRYPRWRDVIPRGLTQSVELAVCDLSPVIKQAAIMTSDESRGVDFSFKEGYLTLSSSTASRGSARIDLPLSYSGPELTVTLSHPYVAEFLRVLDSEAKFTLAFSDAGSAALLTAGDYLYVVMPLSKDR